MCNKYSYNTMQIGFNFTILTAIAIVVAVSSVNAKPVSTNSVDDNQSSDISCPISHINAAVEKSTTATFVNDTLVMSPSNATTVSYPANITTETSTSNDISATTISERTDKDTTTFQTSIEEMTMVQATTIASLETVTENQTPTNQTTESGLLTTRYVIHPHILSQTATTCPSGYTNDANGGCTQIFH
uniref:Uncharacterized protein n=1 Tax=Schizaphis graminum TaxID=13262 RepID=A0A2S2PP35_SCHGA